MDRKTILLGGVFGGIAIYVVPMFVRYKWIANVCKPLGMIVMAAGLIGFIAYDVIISKLTNTDKMSMGEKLLEKKWKSGSISMEKYYEEKKRILEEKINAQSKVLSLAEQEKKLNDLKDKAAKLKNSSKKKVDFGKILSGDNNTKNKKPIMNMDALGGFMNVGSKSNYEQEMKKVKLEREKLRNEQMRRKLNKNKKQGDFGFNLGW